MKSNYFSSNRFVRLLQSFCKQTVDVHDNAFARVYTMHSCLLDTRNQTSSWDVKIYVLQGRKCLCASFFSNCVCLTVISGSHCQGEQLRRAVAEKQRRNYNALLLAVEELVARKIREKQVELNRAAHLTVELEDRLDQLRSESAHWQTKALEDQATATTLHAQLQQATAAAQRTVNCETGPADDAESGFIDPRRVEPDRLCRACRLKPACVVVFPCRHLCLCEGCEVASSNDGETCPVCCCVRSGSLKVFFSQH